MLEALGGPFWPSPRPLSHTQERGDSGERLWPPIAVDGHDEHLFGPPLNHKERGGIGRSRKRPIAFRTWLLFAPERTWGRGSVGKDANLQTCKPVNL
jgi:hypothetical protein